MFGELGETVQRARELLQEFWDVKDCLTQSRVMRTRQTWTLPGEGFYKINFDGAIFESSGRAALGVVGWW